MDETLAPHELWDGRLVFEPAPEIDHQRIVARLFRHLADFVEQNELGEVLFAPVDMLLAADLCLQPDIVYLSAASQGRLGRVINGPADLVMEVLSPRSSTKDRVEKRKRYEAYGVTEYWIVDPERQLIEVLTLAPSGQYESVGRWGPAGEARSRLLSGFAVSVKRVL